MILRSIKGLSKVHRRSNGGPLRVSELKDSELKDSELKDSELKDSELKDSELKYSELKDSELKSPYFLKFLVSLCRNTMNC